MDEAKRIEVDQWVNHSVFTIAKRAGVPIVPAVIVGAWECWPRTRPFPLPGRIRVEFGEVITPEEIAASLPSHTGAFLRTMLKSKPYERNGAPLALVAERRRPSKSKVTA